MDKTLQEKFLGIIERAGFWVVLLVACVSPLARTSLVKSGFYTPKLVLLYVAASILLGFLLFGLLKGFKIKRTILDIPLIIFFGLAVVSTILSLHSPTSLFGIYEVGDGLLTFFSYLVLFFAASSLVGWDSRRRSWLATALFVSALIICALGMFQFLGFDRLVGGFGLSAGRRVSSTYGNPVYLGGFLSLVLPLIVVVLLSAEESNRKLGGLLLFGLFFATLLLTYCRAAWVAFVASLIALVFLLGKRYVMYRRAEIALVGVFVLALLIVGNQVLGTARQGTLMERATTVLEIKGGTAATRLESWKTATGIAMKRPLLGFGPGTYFYTFQKYATLKKIQLEPDRYDADAHNLLFTTAATLGIPALLTLLFILGAFVVWGFRIAREFALQGDLLPAGYWAGAVGYLVWVQFNPVHVGVTYLFWIFMGLVLSLKPISIVAIKHSLGDRIKLIGTGIISLFVVFLLVLTARLFLADYHFMKGIHYDLRGQPGATPEFERMVELHPYIDDYRWSLARRYLREGTSGDPAGCEKAVATGRKATELNPHYPQGFIEQGNIFVAVGDYKKAIGAFQRAVELSPYNVLAHSNLAFSLFQVEEYRKALGQVEAALKVTPKEAYLHRFMGDCYEKLGEDRKAMAAYKKAAELSSEAEGQDIQTTIQRLMRER